jgi:hypothetical protein
MTTSNPAGKLFGIALLLKMSGMCPVWKIKYPHPSPPKTPLSGPPLSRNLMQTNMLLKTPIYQPVNLHPQKTWLFATKRVKNRSLMAFSEGFFNS